MTKNIENPADVSSMNIYAKLMYIREEFYAAGVKKSGINRHAEFEYYELSDIVPVATPIFKKYNTAFITTFPEGKAVGMLVNLDNPTEVASVEFETVAIAEPAKFRMNEVQALGAGITYMRRYLYQLILDMVEKDTLDGDIDNTPVSTPPTRPATSEERVTIAKEITNPEGNADELQLKALKAVLAKLRELDPEKDSFIQEIALKTEGFTKIKKSACEKLIEDTGELIKLYGGEN